MFTAHNFIKNAYIFWFRSNKNFGFYFIFLHLQKNFGLPSNLVRLIKNYQLSHTLLTISYSIP